MSRWNWEIPFNFCEMRTIMPWFCIFKKQISVRQLCVTGLFTRICLSSFRFVQHKLRDDWSGSIQKNLHRQRGPTGNKISQLLKHNKIHNTTWYTCRKSLRYLSEYLRSVWKSKQLRAYPVKKHKNRILASHNIISVILTKNTSTSTNPWVSWNSHSSITDIQCMVFMLWYNYGIAFETKATIWALLAWCTVTEVSGAWCPTESIEQTPMKIKKPDMLLTQVWPSRINPNALSMVLTLKTRSFHLTSFSLQLLTHSLTRSLRQLTSRMCNIATPDSIRQCPWHWQRSNSEMSTIKKQNKIQEYVQDS